MTVFKCTWYKHLVTEGYPNFSIFLFSYTNNANMEALRISKLEGTIITGVLKRSSLRRCPRIVCKIGK